MKKFMALSAAIVLCAGALSAAPKTKVVLWNRIFEDWNRAWCEQQAAAFNAESKTVEVDQQFIPGDGWDEKMKAAQASGMAPDIYLFNYGFHRVEREGRADHAPERRHSGVGLE